MVASQWSCSSVIAVRVRGMIRPEQAGEHFQELGVLPSDLKTHLIEEIVGLRMRRIEHAHQPRAAEAGCTFRIVAATGEQLVPQHAASRKS